MAHDDTRRLNRNMASLKADFLLKKRVRGGRQVTAGGTVCKDVTAHEQGSRQAGSSLLYTGAYGCCVSAVAAVVTPHTSCLSSSNTLPPPHTHHPTGC